MTSGPSCPIGRPWARFQGSVAAWGPFYLAVRSHLCDPSKHGKPKPALIFGGEAHACAVSLGSLFTFMHWRRKWQPTPVFLPGESQGWRPGAIAQSPGREAALAWASLAQRFPASSVLARAGAGCVLAEPLPSSPQCSPWTLSSSLHAGTSSWHLFLETGRPTSPVT